MKKLLLLTLVSIVCASTTFAQIPENGLMGRYELDNGTYVDTSPNGYDLIAVGTGTILPADNRFGEPMKALLLLDDYLTLANHPGVFDFDSENQVSLAVWMKIDQTVIDWTGVLNNWGGFDMGGYYLGLNPSQQIRWNINGPNVIDSAAVPTGIWMHVVAIYDGSVSQLFIDGVMVAQLDPGASITPSVYPFVVGAQSDNDTNRFPGTLDEVLVYNRALTAQEVEDIFNNIPLGIDDVNELSKRIKVAPNPARAEFNITYDQASLGEITSMKITDMKGSTVMQEAISEFNQTFDVSTLNAGVYQITFESQYGAKYIKQLLIK
ncbi:T9SS type A sorting domain-containing protein [Aureisphaera galaxeae]|uniref:LamG-like jellyroll fold domain-containing protein n=1 Tax=Aureisphaera galaxeae TaxID=1538023 RepID=UPI0023504E6B|nr:LamG-like jellyroll fold domain-containing protein [Aureisphaera galaxeae]MDC8004839.1 T9SS type A sorting domain-containing protein [Aureisphaera galaxeae]